MNFRSNLKHNNANYYDSLLILLFVIMVTPAFPNKFGYSLIPSTLVLIISVSLILVNTGKLIFNKKLTLFWVFLYVVVLFSALFSDENISLGDLTELLIPLPTMLFSFWIFNKFKFV